MSIESFIMANIAISIYNILLAIISLICFKLPYDNKFRMFYLDGNSFWKTNFAKIMLIGDILIWVFVYIYFD